MLLGIGSRIPHETGRRHALQIGLPSATAGLDPIGQIGLVDKTIGAVAGDILSTAAHQRNIVGQAWVEHREVVGQQHILLGQGIQTGHMRAANHICVILVFQQDQDDVVKVRDFS